MQAQQHILLVEDDDVDVMTVRRALKDVGAAHPLDQVSDGEDALAFLRDPSKSKPGLILLDLNMPRMNGVEFLAEVKQDPLLKRIPVVILTTSQEESDRLASFNLNVSGYMLKPVDYPQFVRTMQVIRDYWSTSEGAPQ
ncbi:response regulator [Roseateles oligotrophus]|uniref:Response regulator n=1 Tax=Roseateles oligotrophus TaxID=1769250 RepID=A0ABT2YFX5_9BURK|nr:response regulator [Roseateles oligotrophus]MCV2368911.1 response regulator [Roseateles oligotrophus]